MDCVAVDDTSCGSLPTTLSYCSKWAMVRRRQVVGGNDLMPRQAKRPRAFTAARSYADAPNR